MTSGAREEKRLFCNLIILRNYKVCTWTDGYFSTLISPNINPTIDGRLLSIAYSGAIVPIFPEL